VLLTNDDLNSESMCYEATSWDTHYQFSIKTRIHTLQLSVCIAGKSVVLNNNFFNSTCYKASS